jgi:hypothetical protein
MRRATTAEAHVAATGTPVRRDSLETMAASSSKPIAYAELVDAYPMTSIEPVARLSAAVSSSGDAVNARAPTGVGGPAVTLGAAVSVETRTTAVTNRPGAIAANSTSD